MKLEIEVPDKIFDSIPQKEVQDMFNMLMKMFMPVIEQFTYQLETEKKTG